MAKAKKATKKAAKKVAKKAVPKKAVPKKAVPKKTAVKKPVLKAGPDKAAKKAAKKATKKVAKKAAKKVVAKQADPKPTNPPLRTFVRRSPIHGRGVFAKVDIPKGERVIEYKARKITWAQADRWYADDESKPSHTFLFTLDDKYVLDGNKDANSARWINHACNPNCESDTVASGSSRSATSRRATSCSTTTPSRSRRRTPRPRSAAGAAAADRRTAAARCSARSADRLAAGQPPAANFVRRASTRRRLTPRSQ